MKIKRTIPLLLAFTMLATSCGNKEDVVVEETYTAVKVKSIEPTSIEKIVTYSGKFEPIEQVTVIAKLSGTVTNTYKNVGDVVKAGDTLYSIDSSDINMAVNQAQAQAKAADIAIASAENAKNSITGAQFEQQLLSLESTIENLENQLKTATDAHDFSKTSYENSKALYEVGAASKVEFEQAELSYNQSKATLQNLESQIAQTKATYELTKNQLVAENKKAADIGIAQAQASANSASLSVESASKNLNDVSPKSPISGIVSLKGVTNNQMVSTGTAAYTISNIDKVVATINVTENIINQLAVGQNVDIFVKSLDKNVVGTITEINPVATQSSTYPVKITIDNSGHTIKPGMFCEVEIVTERADNVISLPREAVLRNIEEFYVYVVEDDTVVIKDVEVGIDNGENIQIVSGLQNGEKVIVEGQTYVSDKETVNVIN